MGKPQGTEVCPTRDRLMVPKDKRTPLRSVLFMRLRCPLSAARAPISIYTHGTPARNIYEMCSVSMSSGQKTIHVFFVR